MGRMNEAYLQVNACNRLQDGRDFPWKQETIPMSKKSVVYVRIDSDLKEKAEEILKQLGISPSSAITMFYSQIVRFKGLPLNLQLLPSEDDFTPKELDAEFERRLGKIEKGEYYKIDELRELIGKERKP